MITHAEWQSLDRVTIDQGGSVNLGVLVEPSNLTQTDIDHIVSVRVNGNSTKNELSASVVSFSNGLLTMNVRNNGLLPGDIIWCSLRLRYEPFSPNSYVDTNIRAFKGGIAG